jgi:hypothetical protein
MQNYNFLPNEAFKSQREQLIIIKSFSALISPYVLIITKFPKFKVPICLHECIHLFILYFSLELNDNTMYMYV